MGRWKALNTLALSLSALHRESTAVQKIKVKSFLQMMVYIVFSSMETKDNGVMYRKLNRKAAGVHSMFMWIVQKNVHFEVLNPIILGKVSKAGFGIPLCDFKMGWRNENRIKEGGNRIKTFCI